MHFNLKSGIMITLCTSNPGFKVDNVINNVIHLKSRISSLWGVERMARYKVKERMARYKQESRNLQQQQQQVAW